MHILYRLIISNSYSEVTFTTISCIKYNPVFKLFISISKFITLDFHYINPGLGGREEGGGGGMIIHPSIGFTFGFKALFLIFKKHLILNTKKMQIIFCNLKYAKI